MKSILITGRKWKKENWIMIGLAGILLMVLAIPGESKDEPEKMAAPYEMNEEEYVVVMEKRLRSILSKVEGVGRVSTMITMSSSSEKIIEKDTEIRRDHGEGENYSSVETSVITRNDREESPYISKEISPGIEGILVVADGGNNPVVVKNIIDAVQALFPVETHKIKVMKQQ